MEKLKIKFIRYKNIILMEVLSQPEGIRGMGVVYKNEEFIINSQSIPAISTGDDCSREEHQLWIRGINDSEDNDIEVASFTTNKDALDYINKAKRAIREYNNTLEPKSVNNEEFEVIICE